jgi:hypothetical protein
MICAPGVPDLTFRPKQQFFEHRRITFRPAGIEAQSRSQCERRVTVSGDEADLRTDHAEECTGDQGCRRGDSTVRVSGRAPARTAAWYPGDERPLWIPAVWT